jgi:hypothetical protein
MSHAPTRRKPNNGALACTPFYNSARTPNAKIQIKLGLAVFYRRQLVILDTFCFFGHHFRTPRIVKGMALSTLFPTPRTVFFSSHQYPSKLIIAI